MEQERLISSIIDKYIPQFVRLEYPTFVEFIRSYYEFAEQPDQIYAFLSNIQQYNDVDRTTLEFLEYFSGTYLRDIPEKEGINKRTLIKNIVQYYKSKGNEDSFRLLFRLVFNEEIDFYYPSSDMLRVSDGKWETLRSIKVTNTTPLTIQNLAGCEVVGTISGARGLVNVITTYTTSGAVDIAELFFHEIDPFHSISGFLEGETITGESWDGTYSFVETIYSVLYEIENSNDGIYYSKGDRIDIVDSGTGEDGRAIVNSVTKGSVSDIAIVIPGINYVVGDQIALTSSCTGAGAYGKVTVVNGVTGAIEGVELVSGGNNYSHSPRATVLSATGTNAVVMSESITIGKVKTHAIINFGLDYHTATTDITYNAILRYYNKNTVDFSLGEVVIGSISGAEGYLERSETTGRVLGVRVTLNTFSAGETITGQNSGAVAIVYDVNSAIGDSNDGVLCRYRSRYTNRDGHISSSKYIQDSYFYQMFSYMITTLQKRADWISAVKTIHPAGMMAFSYENILLQPEIVTLITDSDFISPRLESLEYYKFKWGFEPFDDGITVPTTGNTRIRNFADIVIDEIANINNDKMTKTGWCFGSDISITI